MLLDLLNQQMIDDEGRRLDAPARVPAGGFERKIGIAQPIQRVGGSVDCLTNVGEHVVQIVRRRVDDGCQTLLAACGSPQLIPEGACIDVCSAGL